MADESESLEPKVGESSASVPEPSTRAETQAETGSQGIAARIGKDIVVAMKARDEHRLTTLRMVKSALRSKEIDKRAPLDEGEENQILTTLIKQRRESIESFTKGGREELAAKERLELAMIEAYLPQAATEDELRTIVRGAIAHLAATPGAGKPGPKDIGPAMRVVKQRILASGIRADGQVVADLVKRELSSSEERVG